MLITPQHLALLAVVQSLALFISMELPAAFLNLSGFGLL
jgi:hypothetical protein